MEEPIMQNQAVEQAMGEMLGKLQDFAQSELNSINKKLFGDILLSRTHNNIVCGRYAVTKKNNYWIVKNQIGDVKGKFSLQLAAVHFMIALMKDKFKLSDSIKAADENLLKYQILHDTLLARLTQCDHTDQFALNLYLSKFTSAADQLANAQEILHKVLDNAKYLNLLGKH